jgi:hypothetical protein
MRPVGNGTIVRAFTRDSGNIAVLKAPGPQVATRLAQVYSATWKVSPIKGDANAFAMHQGALTPADAALLSKCATK